MTEDKAQDKPAELDLTTLERVIAVGDLSKLSPDERFTYYMNVCESLRLNPATQPFAYVSVQGGLKLYATKTATDQLRHLYGITIRFEEPVKMGDVLHVKAHAAMPSGRSDEDVGAVSLGGRGEAVANAIMKCHTKAKRRVTLGICGLGGFSDESELETMPGATKVDMEVAQGEVPTADRQPPVVLVPELTEKVAEALDGMTERARPVVEPEMPGPPAEQSPPPPEEPPIGFDDPPKGQPPPTDGDAQLLKIFLDALKVAEGMKDLAVLRNRCKELKFTDSEMDKLKAAYGKRKRELGL